MGACMGTQILTAQLADRKAEMRCTLPVVLSQAIAARVGVPSRQNSATHAARGPMRNTERKSRRQPAL